MNENVFRILAAVVLFTCVGISSYYRRKADKESGVKISRKADGSDEYHPSRRTVSVAQSDRLSDESSMDGLVEDRQLAMILMCALTISLVARSASAISYGKDFLETGNPGGLSGLKSS